MTEQPIADDSDSWVPVAGESLRLVDFLKLGEMDAVRTRDLVQDLHSLPLIYLGVVSHRPADNRADATETPHVVAWPALAILAGQIDWIVANSLDHGQRMRFNTLRASTVELAEQGRS
jgi:hypothetical protein